MTVKYNNLFQIFCFHNIISIITFVLFYSFDKLLLFKNVKK